MRQLPAGGTPRPRSSLATFPEPFTSLLLPWSSDFTVAVARDAAIRLRDSCETAKGPSLTSFLRERMSSGGVRPSGHTWLDRHRVLDHVQQFTQPEPVANHQGRKPPLSTHGSPQRGGRLDS